MADLRVTMNTGAEAGLRERVAEDFGPACAVNCCTLAMLATRRPAPSGTR